MSRCAAPWLGTMFARAHRMLTTTVALAASVSVLLPQHASAQDPARAETTVVVPPAPVRPDPPAGPLAADGSSSDQSATAASASPAATPEIEPRLAAIRAALSEAPPRSVNKDDWKALGAFYARAQAKVLWIAADALTPAGDALRAEILRAGDWGLEASDFAVPSAPIPSAPAAAIDAEINLGLAALKYAHHARGGRVVPADISRNFDMAPTLPEPSSVLAALATAQQPGHVLTGYHPAHPQFALLRQALLKLRAGQPVAAKIDGDPSVRLPDGPVLRPGMRHPHVALLRQRMGLDVPGEADAAEAYDGAVEAAVRRYQSNHDMTPDGLVGRGTRAQLNGERQSAGRSQTSPEQRILLSMERWRWLPLDLGRFHVWDNIPEYRARVVNDGKVIHQAKIIVGKPETQTPLFSADMRYVVFQPDWGVPNSIKIKEILPYLRPEQSFFGGFSGSDTRVLQRHNLRVSIGGRPVDPSRVNWGQVDIRRYDFIQPPGSTNVLGEVKFRFPNKHDVYMHDTSQRELFNRGTRTFSHGCVRVEQPRRLAEILLAHDKGWNASKVASLFAGSQNNSVELSTRIPVHMTYATAVAADDGTITYHPDIYGHDHRLAQALSGKPLPLESRLDETAELRRQDVRRRVRVKQQPNGPADFFSALFGN